MDERSLIRLSRSGDRSAFERLVLLKRDRAYRIALNVVGDEDEAKDVAQSAFIRLWSVIARYDETQPFDPWFTRIVVNLAIDAYRRRQRLGETAPQGAAGDRAVGPAPAGAQHGADAELMRAELRTVFRDIASALAPAQRVAFTLKEIEGMETEEIAQVMGVKASTVRNHLMQARRILRDELRRRYPEYFKDVTG